MDSTRFFNGDAIGENIQSIDKVHWQTLPEMVNNIH